MVLGALRYSPSTLTHIYTFMMADDGSHPWVIFLTLVVPSPWDVLLCRLRLSGPLFVGQLKYGY